MKSAWIKSIVALSCLFLWVGTFSASVLSDEEIIYYHNDALGSPIVATDANGDVKWREEYSPYGSRLLHESREVDQQTGAQVESSWDEKQWFTGKIEETSLGIQYLGARWYEPEMGRFLSVDPVQFTESNIFSFNRYTYANNNPYRYIDPDGESPVDVLFLAVDVAKLGVAVYKGTGVAAAAVDVGFSMLGVVSPVPGLGQAAKAAKLASVTKKASKPEFIVSPKGTAMPTNKDFNLVDSNKKGGDWFQIHNKHSDAKVDGSPHTHYPKQHGGSRTREIKRTDGGDLDRADSALRNGTMRERRSRGDKGG